MNLLIIDAVRFAVGFILLAIAIKAFLKTRTPAMLYLTIGFALLTVGHLFSDIYFFDNAEMSKIFSEIFDIAGLTALIISVKKS